MTLYRGGFPTWWRIPPKEITQQEQAVVNWMDQEVDPDKVRKLTLLQIIRGWRSREILEYVRSLDWTKRMYDENR